MAVRLRRVAPDRSANDVVGKRALAVGIDAVVVGLCSVAIATVAWSFDGVSFSGGALSLAPFVWLAYAVAFGGTWGQTPGKYLAGVVVVDASGDPPTYRAVAVRELLRVADVVGIGLVSLRRTSQHRRLGDRVAGTIVVRGEREERRL